MAAKESAYCNLFFAQVSYLVLFVIWLKLVLLADMSEDKFITSAGRIPYGFLINIYQKYNATPDQMLEEVKTA